MPKWWNEQQVCGTYTREAYTVGARKGEKGTHVGRVRQGGRARRRRRARQGARARRRGRARPRGARGKGGAYGEGGVHGQGGRARRRGLARARGARGRAGPRGGGAHGQVARTRAPLMVAAAPAMWVAWAHTRAPVNGAQTGGAHGSKEGAHGEGGAHGQGVRAGGRGPVGGAPTAKWRVRARP
jgi:hypothetical protein